MGKPEWKQVGSVRKSDKGAFYLKVTENVTLTKDTVLQLQDPRKRVDEFVAKGFISEEQGAERKAKIPEYIKYDLVLPPPKA